MTVENNYLKGHCCIKGQNFEKILLKKLHASIMMVESCHNYT